MRLSVFDAFNQVFSRQKFFGGFYTAVLASSMLLFSANSWASDSIESFPRAELVEETQSYNTEYRLVLSGLQRKQAVTSGEIERLISGDVKRQVWQLSVNHEVDQILEHFLDQWQGAQILYRCSGLDCGSSNFWANTIFENAKLYGRDANQAYVVAMLPGSPNTIHVLYAVQRSKHKLYFNLDQVITHDALRNQKVESKVLTAALEKPEGWLPGFIVKEGRLDEDGSAVLLKTLQNLDNNVKRRLHLVVHCYESNTMADNITCSNRLADQLRTATSKDLEIPVFGHGALTLPVGKDLKPQLRFILWPVRQ